MKKGKGKAKTSEKIELRPYSATSLDLESGTLRPITLVKEIKTYQFRNVTTGVNVGFRRDDKSTYSIAPGEIVEVSEMEKKTLLKDGAYKEGFIVEHIEGQESSLDHVHNALSDKQIKILTGKTPKEFRKSLEDIDSEITLERVKKYISDEDLPASYFKSVEARLEELKEQELKNRKAPIAREPEKIS